ncbi:MAG TPA: hypothetical protein VG318_08990 [Actinomycetota bacterium]|nr:hypothetical protein [Actinomycetota bacterium]
MAAPALRPLRVGEILDVAIKIYTRNALTLWKIVALVVFPVYVLSAVVTLSTLPDEFLDPSFGTDPDSFDTVEADLWTMFAAQMLLVFVTMVVTTIATGACMKAVSDVYVGAKPEMGSSVRFAARRVHSLVWITLLTFILGGLAAIALIVPGVWLWFSWTVAPAVLLVEGHKGMKALGRSFGLVKGRWWPVFGAVVVGYVLGGIVSGALSAAAYPLIFGDTGDSAVVQAVVNTLVNTIGGILVLPFSAALVAVIYFDLRVRKEGFDLQLLAERIGSAPDPSLRPDYLPPPPLQPHSGEQPPYWPPPPGWKPSGGTDT